MATRKSRKKRRAPVVYVTGKGGSGKTFVAEALATAAARRGLRTALVTAPGGASRVETAATADSVARLCSTPVEALGRLLRNTVRFGFIADRLMSSSTFSAVADAAPGVADIAFLNLLDEIAADRSEEAAYDLVVVDGPASGHSTTLLGAPSYVEAIAFGPAAAIVSRARELVADSKRFRPVLVCPPEELAVVETLSLIEALRDDAIAEPVIAANATYPAPGNEPQLRWLREHRSGRDAEIYLGRYDRQSQLLERLRKTAPDVFEIPRSFPTPAKGRTVAPEENFESPTSAVENLLDRILEPPKPQRKPRRKPPRKTARKPPARSRSKGAAKDGVRRPA
jgi:anion-transporting  ArsA/GET3 family ATPase